MAKIVKVTTIPWCDTCTVKRYLGGRGVRAKYNAPLTKAAQLEFGASWASLCGSCFDLYGIDSSVTEEYIRAQ